MESIVRNVRDIEADERQHLEDLLGHRLKDNQQVIIQVVNLAEMPAGESQNASQSGEAQGQTAAQLPDWCNVYEGLSEQEIAEIEKVILTRPIWPAFPSRQFMQPPTQARSSALIRSSNSNASSRPQP